MQDAHEFLIFLINHINEIIVGEQNAGPALTNSLVNSKSKTPEPDTTDTPAPTWINEIFQVIKKILHVQGVYYQFDQYRVFLRVRQGVSTVKQSLARMKNSVISVLMLTR